MYFVMTTQSRSYEVSQNRDMKKQQWPWVLLNWGLATSLSMQYYVLPLSRRITCCSYVAFFLTYLDVESNLNSV